MKLLRSSLYRLVTGLVGLWLTSIVLHAQQTITATAGQVGVAYSYQVNSSATPPVQYGATGLPAGLAINASSGLITGTPTTPGTVVGSVSVTSGGQTNNANISITIAAAANTSLITSSTTATGTVGTAFSYTITASNSPTSYNITGLPAGLTANTTTGVISGTPTAAGSSSISLSANNSGGTGAAVTLSLTVGAPASAPVISSATAASVAVSSAFSYSITASNTPTSFAASGLPTGLSVDTATGAITGTPTVAGVYTVGLSATNGSGTSATVNLTLTVGALSSITSANTSTGAVGVAYTYTATANPAATSFNISGLPAGLTANTTTGVISGTPSFAGVATVNLSANNATGTGAVLALTLDIGNRPVISSSTSASGTTGSAFTYAITASNSPTSYNATGLPAGLTVNTSTGVISGTPTVAATSTVALTATNAYGTSSTVNLSLSVAAPSSGGGAPVITSATSATAVANVAFTFAVQTSPSATSYTLGGTIPTGLSINTSTGLISGTVTQTGTYTMSVTATNGSGSATGALVLTVNARPTITGQPQSASVAIGGSVVLSVTATGTPTLTYQWRKNGTAIAGATTTLLTLVNFQVGDAGSYSVDVTNASGTTSSQAAAIGIAATAKTTGAATELQANVRHPNGNVYDQVLLTGTSATVTSDTAQVTRISFIDLNDDIVQVEFSGAGTLTLTLENASGPAAPVKYNQPAVSYMKGHASLVITGADETSFVTVFSVGRMTAYDPTGVYDITKAPGTGNDPALNGNPIFKSTETYDGVADIGLISIATINGKFGGIRAANAGFFRASGLTGVSAPGVAVQGPVYLGDVTADSEATGVMIFGSTTDVRITGGDLLQLNGRAVRVDGITRVNFTAGTKSSGSTLPVQTNKARLEQNGIDVTSQLVPP